MILEADEETRDFVTIYKKDYRPKRAKKQSKFLPTSDYNPPLNLLNGPFHEYLNSWKKNQTLSPGERTEDIGDHLKKIRSKYEHLKKFLPEDSLDEEAIERQQKKALKTIYQLDYSKDLDDYFSLRTKKTGGGRPAIKLPDDWVIPETIANRSYRDPRNLPTSGMLPRERKLVKPEGNFTPREKERQMLLKLTTGNSEYTDVIGTTGDRIFKEQLHGDPIPLDAISSKPKGADTISSECSNLLASRKTPFISNVF